VGRKKVENFGRTRKEATAITFGKKKSKMNKGGGRKGLATQGERKEKRTTEEFEKKGRGKIRQPNANIRR